MPPGMIWEIAAAGFGIAAAVLLAVGWVIVRLQRDRHHFQLMQQALEKGVTSMPGMVPGWVISLRQGVLALVLGLGVAGSGIALHVGANSIAEAPTLNAQEMQDQEPPPPPPRRDDRPPDDRRQPPRPSPAVERWHRVQTQKLTGLIATCAGIILALLGIVRIAFARLERTYGNETPPTGEST